MRESEDHASTPNLIALMFWRVPTPKGCKDTTWTKQWTKHLRLCLLNLRFLLHMTCRAILFIMSLSILTMCLTFFHFFSSYEKLCSIYGESLWNILERENLKRKEAMIIARHQLCKVQLRCLSISLFFRLEKTNELLWVAKMAKLGVAKTCASAQDFRFPMCCSWAIFCQFWEGVLLQLNQFRL